MFKKSASFVPYTLLLIIKDEILQIPPHKGHLSIIQE